MSIQPNENVETLRIPQKNRGSKVRKLVLPVLPVLTSVAIC